MSTPYHIQKVLLEPAVLTGLAQVTLDVVQNGASVGFMQPFTLEKAIQFWEKVRPRVEQGEIILLVARETGSDAIIGTVQLQMGLPENQPHRSDVAKMQVHSSARRQGVGSALLKAIEEEAVKAGKTLLVLDTATGGEAERLYSRSGWVKVGAIPEYALWPDGGFCSSTFFYKKLNQI